MSSPKVHCMLARDCLVPSGRFCLKLAIIGKELCNRFGRIAPTVAVIAMTACSIQLVAPYNSELEQKASSLEAEISAWELTMRQGAGTVLDDPRNPVVATMLNKWRGEADAMLTLAVSSDPGTVNCDRAAHAAYSAMEGMIPEGLRSTGQSGSSGSGPKAAAVASCESGLVADVGVGLDDLIRVLKYCEVSWVPDSYFVGLSQNRAGTIAPQSAPSSHDQDALNRSCLAEFKEPIEALPSSASSSAPSYGGARHGRAVSHLLTSLQVIVYVETRKKAASSQ